MCACAVLVCTLFLNSNIDMVRIKDQITDWFASFCYAATVVMSFSISEIGASDMQAFIIALVSFAALYELFMLVYARRIKRIPLKEVMMEE